MISTIIGINRIDKFTIPAIKSMIHQVNIDQEIIVVANGEKCSEVELFLINSNIKIDRIIKTPIGQLAHALNIGIANAKGDFIARMDSDDISHHQRLEKQLAYLYNNNLDVVGCDINLIDEKGKTIGEKIYPKGKKIDKKIRFSNPFAHNTILAKKDIFIKARGYNAGYNSEDYDLWLRLRRLGVKWDNINEKLLDYRIHSAASQRRLLGYAESTGLAMREFVLEKTLVNFSAIPYHFIKALIRSRRD